MLLLLSVPVMANTIPAAYLEAYFNIATLKLPPTYNALPPVASISPVLLQVPLNSIVPLTRCDGSRIDPGSG